MKYNSISKKLAAFLAVMLTLQCALVVGFLLFGGILQRLNYNSMDVLNERVLARKNYLENEMVQRWAGLNQAQETLRQTIVPFLAERGLTVTDLTANSKNTSDLLLTLIDPLISTLRTSSSTGVFLILRGDQPTASPANGVAYEQAGLYFRDMDPTSNPMNDSDILVERGIPDLFRTRALPMDINWMPNFLLRAEDETYFTPLQAAERSAESSAQDLGYWSSSFRIVENSVPVITYSQPLLDQDGTPYGVIGVEISSDYLYRLMPTAELTSDKTGAYLLAAPQSVPNTYYAAATSGVSAKHVLDEENICHLVSQPVYPTIYAVNTSYTTTPSKVYASVQPISLYNSDSPFYGQSWGLIGLVGCGSLFSLSASIAKGILMLALSTIAAGIALSFFAGHIYTRPIRALAQHVRHLDPAKPVSLPCVQIQEIDELASSIERLSEQVAISSARVSRIIELSGVPLAAFELSAVEEPLYTKNFFSLLALPEPDHELTQAEFRAILDGLSIYREEDEDDDRVLFHLPSASDSSVWIRLRTVERDGSTLGVLTDVTDEIVEKRRLEYERDYDLLTNLLNRRSFSERLARLQRHAEELHTAAMLMFDLDNLKYLNDTYGHDCGDQYIRCAADVLQVFGSSGGLAARISGDEFYLFLSGYPNREVLLPVIRSLQDAIAAASILLPNGQNHRLRASMGIAWYPDDSLFLTELVRYADFAMYEAKNAIKGSSRNFNLNTYRRDSFLLYSQEELNRILDEHAVDYAFQPIVSCTDGSVMGYEALMRPRSKALSSPFDVLRIARAQSKLSHIERLTWFRALESFSSMPEAGDNCLVFINSVSSQILPTEDMAQFISTFSPYLHRIVIELTESDEQNGEATAAKQELCRQHGIRLALDDFGTGYSSDSVLLTLKPEFVKADMSIIRGIDQDRARQTMLKNLVTLCRELHVSVIAEGVETREELRTVIALEADYIQGYYTGKPTLCPAAPNVDVAAEIQYVKQTLMKL